MNVNMKYLKDESGNTISPVVSTDSVFKGDTSISTLIANTIKMEQVFSNSSGTTDTVNLTKPVRNYDFLRIFWWLAGRGTNYYNSSDMYVNKDDGINGIINAYVPTVDNTYQIWFTKLISINTQSLTIIDQTMCRRRMSDGYTDITGSDSIRIYKVFGCIIN